jgi:hypothetical protein
MTRKRKPPAKPKRKRAPAPTLDAATLRWVADGMAEAAAKYRELESRVRAAPESKSYLEGHHHALDTVVRRLRNRATRIEKQQAREASIPLSSQHYTSPLL